MEFVIWDDGLSCEDENATESELFAGILYFWKQGIETLSQSGYYVAIKTKCTRFEVIQTVGFLQAIKNFVRVCGQSDNSNVSISTTLSERLIHIQQIGSKLFMAIMRPIDRLSKAREMELGSLLTDAYDIFCLFHGSLPSILARPIEIENITCGKDLLIALQSTRKKIRKLGRYDQTQTRDNEVKALESQLDNLESLSPMRAIFQICEAFFPASANTLSMDSFHPFKRNSKRYQSVNSVDSRVVWKSDSLCV